MKIIIVATTPFSVGRGSHLRILHESIALAKAGHSVEILTYALGSDPEECQKYGIKISRIRNVLPWYKKKSPGPSFGKVILDEVLFLKLLATTFSQHPDILYAHGYEAVVISFFTKIMFFWRKIKLVGDFQGELVTEMITYQSITSSTVLKFLKIFQNFIHQMPGAAIASSRALADLISKDRKKACEVLYDAPTIPYVVHQKTEMRNKYSLAHDVLVVLYTGGFTKDKGIETLYSIIRKAIKENITWVISGGPRADLHVPTDIVSRIRVISPLGKETLIELLSLADCAIDPKERNSLQASGKIINYMQYGLPVFCFDDSVSRDYLGDEIVEVCVGKNIDGIAENIISFQQKQELIPVMQERLRERAKIFSWETISQKI